MIFLEAIYSTSEHATLFRKKNLLGSKRDGSWRIDDEILSNKRCATLVRRSMLLVNMESVSFVDKQKRNVVELYVYNTKYNKNIYLEFLFHRNFQNIQRKK